MRTAFVWIFVLAAAIPIAHAQAAQTADSSQAVRTYCLMREDEDWSFLKNPSLRQDFWHSIKYIRLGPQGWFLTIGGEAREAFEQVGNDNWGAQPYTNTFFLERYMLHMDWHLGRYVRAFVQLKSGLESFRTGGPRPIDEKELDFEAAFVEVGSETGDNWLVLQAGRQELNYGSGRLVSVREGPNVRACWLIRFHYRSQPRVVLLRSARLPAGACLQKGENHEDCNWFRTEFHHRRWLPLFRHPRR